MSCNGHVTNMTLGACCLCERRENAIYVVMLKRPAPVAGTGWGCLQCDLPCDGAIAVLCDSCAPHVEADETVLRFVCEGFPSSGKRIALDELPPGAFDHDRAKHPELFDVA